MNHLKDKHFTVPASELIQLVNDARDRTLELLTDLEDDCFPSAKVGQTGTES